jgi:hypothetical protein
LRLTLFNSRAAFERIVYALDRRSLSVAEQSAQPQQPGDSASLISAHAAESAPTAFGIAAPNAFYNLTQWRPVAAQELRDSLVTESDLGNPSKIGIESKRELSGFQLDVTVQRRIVATLAKSLLPLFLMTLIMFASLYFPHGLVKEKITVAITAALSGAVLLTAINAQLGGVGYTVAVEYAFYVFFGLSTLCVVSVLMAERLRVAHKPQVAVRTEQVMRVVFLLGVLAVIGGAVALL